MSVSRKLAASMTAWTARVVVCAQYWERLGPSSHRVQATHGPNGA